MTVRATIAVHGCCGRFRGQIIMNIASVGLITVEAFGGDAREAKNNVVRLAASIGVDGFDLKTMKERRN